MGVAPFLYNNPSRDRKFYSIGTGLARKLLKKFNEDNVFFVENGSISHQKGAAEKNLTKLAPQFLLNSSGYKHARSLGHDSFEIHSSV